MKTVKGLTKAALSVAILVSALSASTAMAQVSNGSSLAISPNDLHILAVQYLDKAEEVSRERGALMMSEPADPVEHSKWEMQVNRLDQEFNDYQDKATKLDTEYAELVLKTL